MALDYKTPGVYVEEKSLLPPSVAGVATAIPAFIGYTEKKTKNRVQKITSLLEFQTLFGEGADLTIGEDGSLNGQKFVLFDSMRLFFDNGGGTCYVVSTGTYAEAKLQAPDTDVYQDAIKQVAQQSEVTLLVFPDAALLLGADQLKDVQTEALSQCASMVGRFAILDVQQNLDGNYTTPSEQIDTEITGFRQRVTNNLCYGAAYYPYLKTSYSKNIPFPEVLKALGISCELNEGENEPVFSQPSQPTLEEIKKRAVWISEQDLDNPEIKMKMNAIIPLIPGYAQKLEDLKDKASVIPPSGAIAGLYVSTDNKVGVWLSRER